MNQLVAVLSIFAVAMILGTCQEQPFRQGESLYNNLCADCHMEDGTGLAGLIPPLAQADYLAVKNDQVPCIILQGQNDSIVVNGRIYHQPMPAIPQLSDWEIANILNYINHAWGNDYGYVPIDEVQRAIQDCMGDEM